VPRIPTLSESWRDYWLRQWGWEQCKSEPSTFTKNTPTGPAAMQASTDDFLVVGPDQQTLERLSQPFRDAWQITIMRLSNKLGDGQMATDAAPTIQHVGLKIERLSCGGLKISNPKGITDLLNTHGLSQCKPTVMPYKVSGDYSTARDGEERAPVKMYQELVGSFRFFTDTTHPTLSWIVGTLGRHLADPAVRHMDAAKHLLRYLKGHIHDGLIYRRRSPLRLEAYSDSDYASDPDTRKSISGGLILANGQPLHWFSQRQRIVAHSSSEAEYIAADQTMRQLVWLTQLAQQLRIKLQPRPTRLTISDKPATQYHDGTIVPDTRPDISLRVDNTGAIAMARASGPTARTKHLDVRYHYIQDVVRNGTALLQHVDTKDQKADAFTKPVGRVKFQTFAQCLNCS
jgi:hypothetical protein